MLARHAEMDQIRLDFGEYLWLKHQQEEEIKYIDDNHNGSLSKKDCFKMDSCAYLVNMAYQSKNHEYLIKMQIETIHFQQSKRTRLRNKYETMSLTLLYHSKHVQRTIKISGTLSSSIFSLYTQSRIYPLELSDSLYIQMNRKLCLTLFLLLIIGSLSIRIDHLDSNKADTSQADSSAIEWETVEIANLTDEQAHVDEVIRSLVGGLQEFNLTELQIDNGTLDHFIFQYTNDDNHTISIKGAADDNTIRFVTPQGREYRETTRTEKWPNGQEFNLTTVSEKTSARRKGRHSFSRATSFSSFSFIS